MRNWGDRMLDTTIQEWIQSIKDSLDTQKNIVSSKEAMLPKNFRVEHGTLNYSSNRSAVINGPGELIGVSTTDPGGSYVKITIDGKQVSGGAFSLAQHWMPRDGLSTIAFFSAIGSGQRNTQQIEPIRFDDNVTISLIKSSTYDYIAWYYLYD